MNKPKNKIEVDKKQFYLDWFRSLSIEDKKGYKLMYPKFTYKQMFNRMIGKFGLILLPPLILSKAQCKMFRDQPNINPITKRKIKKKSKTYNKIKKACDISIHL